MEGLKKGHSGQRPGRRRLRLQTDIPHPSKTGSRLHLLTVSQKERSHTWASQTQVTSLGSREILVPRQGNTYLAFG